MSRLERLVNLTAALLDTKRPLSAEALRERIPGYPEDELSFKRQFARDKEALRGLGLPLITIQTAGTTEVTYRIDPDQYYVNDPGLTPDELSALTMAAEVVRLNGLGDRRLTDPLWKLDTNSANPAHPASSNRVAAASGHDDVVDAEMPASEAVAALFAAIADGVSVRFTYRDEPRQVVPQGLSFERGRWYVACFDIGKNEDRLFRIDRIVGDITTAPLPRDIHVPPTPARRSPTRSPWELGSGDAVTAVIRVDELHAAWAQRHVEPEAVSARFDDGSIELSLQVRNIDGFRSFVLGFLDGAEVLSPESLRVAMVEWLEQVGA
jgi:proteasome accessory factor B